MKEAIFFLNLSSGKVIVDCTLGGGGHSREIYKTIRPDGILIAIDRDEDAIKRFDPPEGGGNIKLVNGNFSNLDRILSECKVNEVDGILFDLGVSIYQLKGKDRGFSILEDGPLDMRMDRREEITAADVVNSFSEKDIADIIYKYGEEVQSRKIAREIVKERQKNKIISTSHLADIIKRIMPSYGKKRIHPATRTFMALRIWLNREFEAIEEGLRKGFDFLKPGGRMVVISFHSLEDRIVKTFFKDLSLPCRCPKNMPICRCEGQELVKIITKKPVVPEEEELLENLRARSAKLRAIEKLPGVIKRGGIQAY